MFNLREEAKKWLEEIRLTAERYNVPSISFVQEDDVVCVHYLTANFDFTQFIRVDVYNEMKELVIVKQVELLQIKSA